MRCHDWELACPKGWQGHCGLSAAEGRSPDRVQTLLHIQTGAKANSLSLPCASSCPVGIITNSAFFTRPHNLGKNVACGNLLGTKKKHTHTHTHTVLDQEKGLWSLIMGGKPTRKYKTSFYNANCEERSGHWFGFRLISMLWCAVLSG